MRNGFLLSLLIGLTVLLSACGLSGGGNANIRIVSSDVQNYDGPEGTVAAYIFTGMVSDPIGSGTISSSGALSVELDESVPASELLSIADVVPAGLDISDTEVQAGQVYIEVVTNDIAVGQLMRTSYSDISAVGVGAKEAHYFYVDREVSVSGTATGQSMTSHADLDLKTGWNLVIAEVTEVDSNGKPIEINMTTGGASGLEWHYFAY